MSINYTTLFTQVGKSVKTMNLELALQGTVLGYGTSILDQYNSRRDLVPNVQQNFQGFANGIQSWEQTLTTIVQNTLADLQLQLNSPTNSMGDIIPRFIAQMVADTQTVLKSTPSITSITAGSGNVGNGVLVASVTDYAGANDQMIINESVLFQCKSDDFTSSQFLAGAEQFTCVGYPSASTYDGISPRGSGTGTQLQVFNEANNVNFLTNGDFETFGNGTFTSWTYAAGGTLIGQETVNFHSGTSAMKLSGNGSNTTVTATQPISAVSIGQFQPLVTSIWLRKNGTVTAGSNLKVWISGTGISNITLYNADPSTLTTSYVHNYLFSGLADVLPSNLQVNISWTAANVAGASAVILIDDFVVAKPYKFGNVNYALIRGSTDFRVGDTFTVVTANDFAGVFQTFFGRFFNVQLPSSASPSISDSLAT